MPHQMGEGNVVQSRINLAALGQVRLIRQQLEHAVIELQLALLDQLQCGHGGEGLGNTGDAKQRIRLDRLPALAIGVAEPARVHQPPSFTTASAALYAIGER